MFIQSYLSQIIKVNKNMSDLKNNCIKSKHKKRLRENRLKKLEKQLKSNISKRKKILKINNG